MTETGTPTPLPSPDDWNAAVGHSKAHPTHILGPYEDEDGITQMECLGSGDPYESSNCSFATLHCARCGSIMHAQCYPGARGVLTPRG